MLLIFMYFFVIINSPGAARKLSLGNYKLFKTTPKAITCIILRKNEKYF